MEVPIYRISSLVDNYAIVGVSRGAELALLLGSRYRQIKAIVAIDPSSVVFPGPPTSLLDAIGRQHSAWSEKGQELPFVRIPYSCTTIKGMASGKRTRMFENPLEDTLQVKTAAIPAEQIRGAILLVSFMRDQIGPSPVDYLGVHSQWSIKACHDNMLTFLNERFLKN